MALQKIGRFLILFFAAMLPWSVIVSVAGVERLDISITRFSKEIILLVFSFVLIADMWRKKYRPTFDILDGAIVCYVIALLGVSVFTHTTLTGFIYGLRYDAEFFFAFMFFRQAMQIWKVSFREIAKIFIISGGIMLFISILIRYVFGETILTIFGFSEKVSVWDGSGPPPIYHGIPGASVVRFQGMLEGPNQMAFFLLVYMGTYISLLFRFKKYRFINGVILFFLLFLLTQTYSRSGLMGCVVGCGVLFGYFIVEKIRHYRQTKNRHIHWQKIGMSLSLICLVGLVGVFQFGPKFTEIIARKGSTSAHFERMYIGYLRFLEQPLGHGLAQAGPASRAIADINQKEIPIESINPEIAYLSDIFIVRNPDFIFSTEHYYIPESWYIQQLIEGGIIGFFFFVMIFVALVIKTKKYPAILAVLAGVIVMNTFLHSFESVHTALILFLILASITSKS